ncbi:hypothetical protein CRYPD_1114 [uncultured Candidatus Thioglobus sp.]|nr:hypothetical protein CRYPD_1114 [uncultured Candidatus Thioglobus sp.]
MTDFIKLGIFLNSALARLRMFLKSFQVDERGSFSSYL